MSIFKESRCLRAQNATKPYFTVIRHSANFSSSQPNGFHTVMQGVCCRQNLDSVGYSSKYVNNWLSCTKINKQREWLAKKTGKTWEDNDARQMTYVMKKWSLVGVKLYTIKH